jgi:hypothetical protein
MVGNMWLTITMHSDWQSGLVKKGEAQRRFQNRGKPLRAISLSSVTEGVCILVYK